jgi:hypothetical protein
MDEQELDSRLRGWVDPDTVTIQRVMNGALTAHSRSPVPRVTVGLVLVAVLAAAGAATWRWRAGSRAAVTFIIETSGDQMIVRAEGKTWIVGPRPAMPNLPEGTGYIILEGVQK